MKVLIVDDHPLVRRGLLSIFELEPDIQISGEATNICDGLKLIETACPELALVDLRLAQENGLDLIKESIERGYHCKFVVLTSFVNQDDVRRAEMIGVQGFILKEALPEELMYAVRIISKGRKYYDPGILELMMEQDYELEFDKLSLKEKEVLCLLGKGLSNKEIGQKLFITEFTVKKHVSQVLAKLELKDRTQAALYANSKGIV